MAKKTGKQLHLFQHATGVRLATIPAKNLNWWCDTYGYLPHHKVQGMRDGYVVIAK